MADGVALFMAWLLTSPALLGLLCFLIHIGVKRDCYGLVIGSGLGLTVIVAPAALFGASLLAFYVERTLLYTILYVVMGLVWSFLAFHGLNHANERKGKALLVFSLLWAFWLPMPLEVVSKWSTSEAFLVVFSLAAVGYVVLGILIKLIRGAQRQKEALHKRLLEEVDTREKPPWEQ